MVQEAAHVPAGVHAPPLRARLLGQTHIAIGERAIPADAWPPRGAQALLLLLLITPEHRLPRDRVLDLLWPDAAPEAALNALYKAMHALRRVLEPDLRAGRASSYVAANAATVRLLPDPRFWLDVDTFTAALDRAQSASPGDRLPLLREALALYGGDLLPDEPYADWPVGRREELRRAWETASLDLADVALAAGEPFTAIAPLEALLAAEPTLEEAHRALMSALAGAGRRERALGQYQRCVEVLAAELGVEPSTETRTLAGQIRSSSAVLPPLSTGIASRSRLDNLPAPPNPLVGRTDEIAALHDLLWDPAVRLVTITGPGGIGKTRLALEAARQIAADFANGACFVPLAPIQEPALVLPAIGHALGLEDMGDRPMAEIVGEALRERDVLLILDNLEQVVEAAPDIATLLEWCARLKVLATSREPLQLRAEHRFPTAPLPVPHGGHGQTAEMLARYGAVLLFTQRARAVRPDFTVTDADVPALSALCAGLDGLPLAIELAAARAADHSLDELLAGLTDRFALLAGGYRDLPARQRTMRDAIAWSIDLLTEQEISLLRRLAVFVGGFSLDAASPPDLVASLANKNLVRIEENGDGDRGTMLETIREYGLELLAASGEEIEARRAHAAYVLDRAECAGPALDGPEAVIWLDRLEADHENIRAALGWSLDRGDAETALRIGIGIHRFWEARGFSGEGRRWLDRALAAGGDVPPAVRARACYHAAGLAGGQDDLERADALHWEGLEIQQQLGDHRGIARSFERLGAIARRRGDYVSAARYSQHALETGRANADRRLVAKALGEMGMLATYQGDYARADELYRESLACYRELQDQEGTAHALNSLGDLTTRRGNSAEGVRLWEEALGHFRRLGDNRGLAATLLNLGDAYARLGNVERAQATLDEAVRLAREYGYPRSLAIALFNQGNALHLLGRTGEAAPLWTESIALIIEIGDPGLAVDAMEELAGLLSSAGKFAEATCLWGSAEALRDAIGTQRRPGVYPLVDETIVAARDALGPALFAGIWNDGRALAPEQATAHALREVG